MVGGSTATNHFCHNHQPKMSIIPGALAKVHRKKPGMCRIGAQAANGDGTIGSNSDYVLTPSMIHLLSLVSFVKFTWILLLLIIK